MTKKKQDRYKKKIRLEEESVDRKRNNKVRGSKGKEKEKSGKEGRRE